MTVKYDAFFDWLKNQPGMPGNLRNNQYIYPPKEGLSSDTKFPRYSFGMRILNMPYKGLELLVKNDLIIGGPSPVESEKQGIFIGAQYNSPKDMAAFDLFQVFQVPEGVQAADNLVLPVVARITVTKSIKHPEYHFEFCPAAKKYGI